MESQPKPCTLPLKLAVGFGIKSSDLMTDGEGAEGMISADDVGDDDAGDGESCIQAPTLIPAVLPLKHILILNLF